MLVTVGPHGFGTYIIFGSFAAAMLVFVYFFIPETKGLSLEAMDALFGVVPHDERALAEGRMGAVVNLGAAAGKKGLGGAGGGDGDRGHHEDVGLQGREKAARAQVETV